MNNNSLVESLNQLRELSSDLYHKFIPVIDDSTDIGAFANAVFANPEVFNEFCGSLINRIVYTAVQVKLFNNPLKQLEGDQIPLGYAGQEIFVNRAKGRNYNVNDFAGLLIKYESDPKVQYLTVNSDVQYPVTISREALKKAFVSFSALGQFIEGLINSLYNGAYIDEYRYTKYIVSGAYKDNKAIIEQVSDPTASADNAKALIKKIREYALNFQAPSSNYNSWSKDGGAGDPIVTWTEIQDLVLLIRNDVLASTDVEVLASAFNMSKTEFMGRVIGVDNFDGYSDAGVKVYDGSAIVGILADKAWFKIKTQDQFMDTFYNANNRTMQYYLNMIKMYSYSLFANAVIFATALPTRGMDSGKFLETAPEVKVGETVEVHLETNPFTANETITFTSGTAAKGTVAAKTGEPKTAVVTGVAAGTTVITATGGTSGKTATVTVTVKSA